MWWAALERMLSCGEPPKRAIIMAHALERFWVHIFSPSDAIMSRLTPLPIPVCLSMRTTFGGVCAMNGSVLPVDGPKALENETLKPLPSGSHGDKLRYCRDVVPGQWR